LPAPGRCAAPAPTRCWGVWTLGGLH
jgi:hypothetical protein